MMRTVAMFSHPLPVLKKDQQEQSGPSSSTLEVLGLDTCSPGGQGRGGERQLAERQVRLGGGENRRHAPSAHCT